MDILNPEVPSADSLKVLTAKQIRNKFNFALNTIITEFNSVMNLVWDNKSLTPQQVCDAFGQQASQLFILATTTKNFIQEVSPQNVSKLLLPKKQVSFNEDGTVVVLEADYIE